MGLGFLSVSMVETQWIALLIVAMSGIVSAGAVLIFFWRREVAEREKLLSQQILHATLTLRLQALERVALFLERNDPNSLFPRLEPHQFRSAADLIQVVARVIQEEYLHNAAQQIYVGPRVWWALRQARQQLLSVMQETMVSHPPTQIPPLAWVEKFKEKWRAQTPDPFQVALSHVHAEMQRLLRLDS
jgi:hypothetical protein